ncbi:hypothetical protein DPMN_131707 [Dreissena polymorpha]|uniref:Uncharacterized protein n=1 Tax=Dreissena polymorpha TaxID=45954 RepID=A0A9D4FSG2_DREPO|nr:hypothetical protein DPMN_131707 [Dreissena polymorpha]
MEVAYNCKEVADIIPMCGGPLKKTTKVTKSTDIWFDGSTETFDPYRRSKECKCSFTNLHTHNSTELFLALIDVRLESHNPDVNASTAMCSNAILQSVDYSWRCKESTEHWKDNFVYRTSEVSYQSITLSPGQTRNVLLKDIHRNGPRDIPAMIWFYATVTPQNSDLMLNMTCEEVIPTELTTSLTAITQQPTAADTTRADTMASDGNLSTGAIVAISVGSWVALTLVVVVVSSTVYRALRTR